MERTPINLAMLKIILASSLLDEGAKVVAVHPDGSEHPVVAALSSLEPGRATLRLELGPSPWADPTGTAPWRLG